MLQSVILLQPYGGVSAGYETAYPKEIAEQLIKEGIAIALPVVKIETKKVGK
jgi:hypothetical protein